MGSPNMKKTILVLLGLFLLSSCVTTKEYRRLQNRVNYLEKNYTKEHKRFQSQIQDISRNLNQVKKRTQKLIASNTNSVRQRQANLWSQMRKQRENLAKVQGNQDVFKMKIGQLQEKTQNNTSSLNNIQNNQKKIQKKLNLLLSQLNIQMPSENATQAKTPPQTQSAHKTISKPEILYNKALNLFNSREYQNAQSIWSDFVEKFPEHELVPNAHFWQGESYFQMQNYSQAILKYQKVIEKYTEDNKYPAALLKQGIAFYKKGKEKPGKIVLKELIEKFPESNLAQRGKKFLQEH